MITHGHILKSSDEYALLRINYPFLCSDRDRHGNVRVYFRHRGRKIRLRAQPGTAEFQAEYDAVRAPRSVLSSRPYTYRDLVIRYVGSPVFRRLELSTQRQKRRVLESTCLEPFAPNSEKVMGQCPLSSFARQHVRMLRDRKSDHPEAARHRMKTMSQMFDWALDADIEGVSGNPILSVKYPRPVATGGHHTWSWLEKQQFEDRHPIGSKARLAFALLYYTGLRVSDVVRLGHAHLQADGSLRITLHKNRNRNPVTLQLPILPELRTIMNASCVGEPTFLVTDHGKSFSSEKSFGNKVRDWCDQAGLRHCTAHGLRKAGATLAAENGATPHELKAMYGWLTLKQAETYTRMAEQKLLAARGMTRLSKPQLTETGP